MISLPEISDYSEAQLSEAKSWPAIARYLSLLQEKPDDFSDKLRIQRHQFWLRSALATFFENESPEDICRFWSQSLDNLIKKAWVQAGLSNMDLVVFAVGKLGAEELNLSSDVDLIYVRSEKEIIPVKALQEFQSLLSTSSEFGFCSRVDVSIRPGGSAANLCPSASELENHYGNYGEMWERLALVRLRSIAGNKEVSEEIMNFARKFSFRKHMDFGVLDELRQLRQKIRLECPRRIAKNGEDFFHLKLSPGGIREIELFVHSLQIMHGGRKPWLQTRSTSEALRQIEKANLLPAADCQILFAAYWEWRRLENRLQAESDQQNYWIVASPDIRALSSQIMSLTDTLLAEPITESPARKINEQNCLERLDDVGVDKVLGKALFHEFLGALRAKEGFFALLSKHPLLLDDLLRLFSVSPYLGNLLCARPELIDTFIWRTLQNEMSEDMEIFLDQLAERRVLSELISAQHFLANHDLGKLCANLTKNADEICLHLLKRTMDERTASESDPRLGPSFLAMGKWGGKEMGFKSDLDFIFVQEKSDNPESQKITRRLITRLTQARPGGSIYSIDMRLRPSGSAGPLLVSWSQLHAYILKDAASWERQAYLRSRLLSPDSEGDASTFNTAELAASRGLQPSEHRELKDIASKLFQRKEGEVDLKLNPGGLASIEFAAQISLLDRKRASLDPSCPGMIQFLGELDTQWRDIQAELLQIYDELRRIEQMNQLTANRPGAKIQIQSDEGRRLAMIFKSSPTDFYANLDKLLARASKLLADVQVSNR